MFDLRHLGYLNIAFVIVLPSFEEKKAIMFENSFPRHVSDVTDILTQSLFQLSTSTNFAVAIYIA